MLVLTRLDKEGVRILLPDGREVFIQLLKTSRGSARLGFQAPKEIKILREELEINETKTARTA